MGEAHPLINRKQALCSSAVENAPDWEFHMFYYKDVESAVNWLREEIEKMFEKEYCDGKKDKSCKKILRKLKKAFPDLQDVTKGGR